VLTFTTRPSRTVDPLTIRTMPPGCDGGWIGLNLPHEAVQRVAVEHRVRVDAAEQGRPRVAQTALSESALPPLTLSTTTSRGSDRVL
jgi:hypothetical protein